LRRNKFSLREKDFQTSPTFVFFPFSFQKNGEQVYDKCQRYAVDWKIMLKNVEIDSLMPNESWSIESCDKGWEYNKTDVQSSIVIDVSLSQPPFHPSLWIDIEEMGKKRERKF
jgi:hypothetical protein